MPDRNQAIRAERNPSVAAGLLVASFIQERGTHASLGGWLDAVCGGRSWAQLETTDEDTPEATFAALPADVPVILIYDDPISALCWAMQQGRLPGDALADWLVRMQAVARTCRRRRRTTLLVEAAAMMRDPAGLAGALESWLGSPQQDPVSVPSQTRVQGFPPILKMIAMQTLRGSRKAQQLAGELAVSGFAETERLEASPDAAFAAWRDLERERGFLGVERSALKERLAENEQRLALVLQESDRTVEELRAARGQGAETGNALQEGAERDLRGLQELERMAAQGGSPHLVRAGIGAEQAQAIAQASPAIAAMGRRMAADEAARLALTVRIQDQAQELMALREQRRGLLLDLRDREAELEAFRESTSWRVTAPLRATRRIVSGREDQG